MKKRILAVLLSMAMALAVVPEFAVFASSTSEFIELSVSGNVNEFAVSDTFEISVEDKADRYSAPLSEATAFDKYLVDNLVACKGEIDLKKYNFTLTEKQINDRSNLGKHIASTYPQLDIQRQVNKYPDLYNVHSWNFKISGEYVNGVPRYSISSVEMDYYYSYAQYLNYNNAYKAVANYMVADLINSNLTDLEKALLLHDRIALHCEYDYDNYVNGTIPDDSYNMYGALVNKISVCQGYAKSYQYMLDMLGIQNRLCSSDTLQHVWNIVTIDGEEYHVDITWDDPVYDVSGRVMHDNFMLSSEGIYNADHEAFDYDTTPDDYTYDDYFWDVSETAFQYVGDSIYYVNKDSSDIKLWLNGATPLVLDISGYGNQGIMLNSYKNKLYYLYRNKIYSFSPTEEGAVPQVVYEPELPYGYDVYGFKIENGKLIIDSYYSPSDVSFQRETVQLEAATDISADLKAALSNISKSVAYNGNAHLLDIAVVHDGHLLIENRDYIVAYKNNVNAGVATVTLTAQNGYKGSATATFAIKPSVLTGAKVSNIVDKSYTGKALTQAPIVTLGSKRLVYGKDYSVSYSSNTSTGKATTKINGIGNYSGTITKYFYIHPKKVTGLKLSSATASYVKISWSKSPSGTGYAVRRKTSKSGSYKTIAIINSRSTTSYKDKNVSANKTYYYDIVAFKTVSGKKYTSTASSLLTTKTATKTPKITYYKNTSSKKAKIKWGKVSGASGYKLYMSTKKSSGYKSIYSGTKLSYTKSKLKKGKTYYFKLRTYRTVNGKKIYSSYSSVKKVKIKK